MVLQECSQFIIRALLWLLLRQSSSLSNLVRDSASRAGGGLLSLQTDDKQADNRLDIIVFLTVGRLQRRLPGLTFYVRHTGLRFSIKEKYNNKPEISLELPKN